MGPFYTSVCSELGREVDTTLLSDLEAANKAELAKLEEGIEDATKNFGETEQRDALMAKAEYLCKIGDKVRITLYTHHRNQLLELSGRDESPFLET